jgi:hypothetical protein
MRRFMVYCLTAVLGGGLTTSQAQVDLNNEDFARAAVVVLTFDYLAAGCNERGGFAPNDLRAVSEWESLNAVAQVRRRIEALEADRGVAARLATIRAGIRERMQPVYPAQSCMAAAATVRLDDAQLARNSPDLIASLVGTTTAAAPAKPRPADRSPTARPRSTGRAVELAKDIDSFGFHTRMTMGVGGFLTTTVYPIVLFKDGQALKEVAALNHPEGIDAHRRARPKDWTRWRRGGKGIQIIDSQGAWDDLAFPVTYATLPKGFKLDGLYRSMSGAGTVGVGGTDSVAAWRDYTFAANGRVVREGDAGAYSAIAGSSTAVASIAPDAQGRYTIDGLTLRITYDGRSTESRIIVTDPKDPKGAIWLDGGGYVRR